VTRAAPRTAAAALLHCGAPDWGAALALVAHDIYHLSAYAQIDAGTEDGHARAFCYREGDQVLLLPMVVRNVPGAIGLRDACTPYGYSGPVTSAGSDAEFLGRALVALVQTMRTAGIITLFARLHPLLPNPLESLAGIGHVVRHGDTVSVDLTQSVAEAWHDMRRGHRNQVHRARRAGLRYGVDDWELFAPWLSTYHANMRALGAAPRYFFPVEYFRALRAQLPGQVHLVTVTDGGGGFVGGTVLFEHGSIVQAHLAATRWEHDAATHAGKLLDSETAGWARGRGAQAYHLGGGAGGQNDALFHYKAGFSKSRHPFHTWRVVADPEAYRALSARCAGVDLDADLDGDSFFPAYRRTDVRSRATDPRNSGAPTSPSASTPLGRTTCTTVRSRMPRSIEAEDPSTYALS